jgi:chemotaxis protein methyltransferase CheR
MSVLAAADFEFMRRFAHEHAALVISSGKEYLVESRLTPVAKALGFSSLGGLIASLREQPRWNVAREHVIDALTTNETLFFRDLHPFEALRRHILPELLKRNAAERTLRIWSAACSTGQEPYSVAMLLDEYFPELRSWTVQIIATDLSRTVLAQAQAASYSSLEVNRGLPAKCLVRYFQRNGDAWVLKPEVRRCVEFRVMNLIEPWPTLPPLDIVLLRNVMIYFDDPTKTAILKRLRTVMRGGAYLFLGTAETTLNLDPTYDRVTFDRATVYRTPLCSPAMS